MSDSPAQVMMFDKSADNEFTVTFRKEVSTGAWVLVNNEDKARPMFDAIVNACKPAIREVKVCPLCERKLHKNSQKYQPTREMVDIMFEMAKLMRNDPQQRNYVKMVERPEKLNVDERIIGTSTGIKQNHKMRLLGLISCVDTDGLPCERTTKHLLGTYTITERGWEFLKGVPISPWQIHVKGSKVVLLDEDKQTSGSIGDVHDFSYEEWKACLETIALKVPT